MPEDTMHDETTADGPPPEDGPMSASNGVACGRTGTSFTAPSRRTLRW